MGTSLTKICWPRSMVGASLSGNLLDHSWCQATTCVTCGGLGLRTALGIPLPAFVASRITCRPLVSAMVGHAFGVPNQSIMAECDARTDTTLARLVSTLPANAAQLPVGQLDEALVERELLWRDVLSGTEEAMQDLPTPSLRHARGITPDDGDGDDEHPLARKRLEIQAPPLAWTRGCIEACFRCVSRMAPGVPAHDCRNLWMPRSITRCCDEARGVR